MRGETIAELRATIASEREAVELASETARGLVGREKDVLSGRVAILEAKLKRGHLEIKDLMKSYGESKEREALLEAAAKEKQEGAAKDKEEERKRLVDQISQLSQQLQAKESALEELEKFHSTAVRDLQEKVQLKAREDREVTESALRKLREELLEARESVTQLVRYKSLNEANNLRVGEMQSLVESLTTENNASLRRVSDLQAQLMVAEQEIGRKNAEVDRLQAQGTDGTAEVIDLSYSIYLDFFALYTLTHDLWQ